ncbi:MAG: ATP-binding protein [Acidobacteriota bacterium]
MKKLRLYFALFFILVAVPIAILLKHTYTNLAQESFFFYRKTAEGVMATVHQRLQQSLQDEEQRPYTHYRYIHVADRPVPQQEGLNLSPLAGFPVQSEIPGILGYYQIDPDGSFRTPLLPDGVPDNGIVVPHREEREQLRDRLASLLKGQTFYASSGFRAQQEGRRLEESTAPRKKAFSNLRENLESNVDVSLEKGYDKESSQQYALVPRGEEEKTEGAGYFERRVQKTSPKQAQVFDSKLKDAYSEELDKAIDRKVSPPRSDVVRNRAPGREENRALEMGDDLVGSRDVDVNSAPEVVAEVDPFRSQLIDKEWLVFYRKVWSQDRRYIQGFVTRLTEFLQAHLNPNFLNSALPGTASYLVFYQGEIMQPAGGHPTNGKPLLLYSSALPHPLSDFHLAITVDRLPKSPGHQVVNFLAVFLSLLFIGGLLGIYRLTTTQMELSRKKSDFVSAVSHELKTPLTAIRMYGEMLMEGWVEEEKKERYYEHIHDESERLSRLIQNVLTLAELERNEGQMNLTARNPVEFVTGIVERLSNQVKRAGFEVATITEGEPKPIQADDDALTQILINLIDNAIKFSKGAETKKIVLTVSQVGTDCYIRVRDFGPGIPRRKLKRIFEKFYRIDNEMTRTTRGTGIGLALVKMLADAMRAHVDVANRRPGAEFSVRFPTAPV